jgi:glycosyltransferase involved in cell wall biosynthesis
MAYPLVSILIPFKNTAAFLPECLASIQKQTYEHWEVLAVDDHSEDTSLAILESFAKEDKRFKVAGNKGHGIIMALRNAYSMATGAYLTRMDSDDIMMPTKLEVMMRSLLQSGNGFIALGKVRYFSSRGVSNGYRRYEEWLNGLIHEGINFSERYKECVIPSPCWMASREDLQKCGAFDHDLYPEDYDLAFRMFATGLQCLPCKEVLHLWRDYDTRTSRTSIHYAQNYFLDIKIHYFLKLDWDKERPLVIWGAGTKGKTIAKALLKQKIPFRWMCDNPNKIGKKIYGTTMLSYREIVQLKRPQSIITVANRQAQVMISHFFEEQDQVRAQDYFFFC